MGRLTQQELGQKLSEAMALVEVGGLYHHFKDPTKHYKVIAIGFIEEREEVCVVYQALYGEKIAWVRTLEVWLSKAHTDNGEVSRFQKVQ
jgi:hypothetical protein